MKKYTFEEYSDKVLQESEKFPRQNIGPIAWKILQDVKPEWFREYGTGWKIPDDCVPTYTMSLKILKFRNYVRDHWDEK